MLYYVDHNGQIFNFNSALPISATNPVANTLPAVPGGFGLAISNNLNGPGPSPTFYLGVASSSGLNYWNGTAWVSTGVNIGANIGGSGNYIFNSNAGTSYTRYNGSSIMQVLGNASTTEGVLDVAGDCQGNFYVMIRDSGNAVFRQYDPNGSLLQSYNILNFPAVGIYGGGLAIINGEVYLAYASTLYKGTITGNNISFSLIGTLPGLTQLGVFDLASCPGLPLGQGTIASIDTAYACQGTTVPVSVTGVGPFTWSVVSGAATLSATTGSSIVISPSTSARVRVVGSNTSCGYALPDTITVVVPTATVDAGPSKTFLNCGLATTTLAGSLTGTTPGITYNLAWTPPSGILSGANTLTPTINPLLSTLYTLTATTPANRGGCTFSDTVRVTVTPAAPPFTLQATRDTVFCEPTLPFYTLYAQPFPQAGYYTYAWSGAAIVGPANIYNPKPVTSNGTRTWYVEVRDSFGCHTRRDTVTLTFHNLTASVTPLKKDICPGDTVMLRTQASLGARWRYAWSPTTGLSCPSCATTVARPLATTLYAVTLTDSNSGCQLYRTSELTSYTYPDSFSAGPDQIVRPTAGRGRGASFTLQGKAPSSAQFLAWTPAEQLDDPFSAVTNGRVDSTTVFVLAAANGPCASRDTAVVYYVACAGAAMPNAFSPNGDRMNDVFTLANPVEATGEGFSVRSFRIYNRWGTLVHSETGSSGSAIALRGWDGTLMGGEPQPYGAYVWHLSVECVDKATGERTPVEMEGNVLLVR